MGFTLLDGSTSDFDVTDGAPGTIIRESASTNYSAWIIDLDTQPGRWFEVEKSIVLPLEIDFQDIKADSIQGRPAICSCAINNIMTEGCTCGHIERYKPAHLRKNVKV